MSFSIEFNFIITLLNTIQNMIFIIIIFLIFYYNITWLSLINYYRFIYYYVYNNLMFILILFCVYLLILYIYVYVIRTIVRYMLCNIYTFISLKVVPIFLSSCAQWHNQYYYSWKYI